MENSKKTIDELIEAIVGAIGELAPNGSLVEKIGEERYLAILRKTVYSLPDRPSDVGMTAAQIKAAFYKPITDKEGSIYAEINRIAEELNLGGAQIEAVLTLMSELVAAIYNNSVDKTSFDDKMKEVAESLGKCVKRADGEGENIYASAGGKDQLVPISSEALPDTAVKRDNAGHVKVAAPDAEDDAVSLGYARRTFAQRGDVPTSVANALIGSEMGEAVALKDVSPIEHNLKVKISGVDNPEAVKVLAYGGNLADIYGFSTEGIQNVIYDRFLSNEFGTTISTTDAANSVEVIQTKSPNASDVTSYENGYFCIGIHNNFQDGDIVTVSFDVKITSNSLNATEGLVMSNGLNADRFELKNGRCSATLNWGNYNDRKYIEIRNAGCSAVFSNFQVELEGLSKYEPYKEPIEYAQGEEIKSIYPSTTLMTDTEGAVISVEYNRDINKAFEELMKIILSLGGNLYV